MYVILGSRNVGLGVWNREEGKVRRGMSYLVVYYVGGWCLVLLGVFENCYEMRFRIVVNR